MAWPARHWGARASTPRSYVKTSTFGPPAEARSRLRAHPNEPMMASGRRTKYDSWPTVSAAFSRTSRWTPVGTSVPVETRNSHGVGLGTVGAVAVGVCAPATCAQPMIIAAASATRALRLWLDRERRGAMAVKVDVSFMILLQGRMAG